MSRDGPMAGEPWKNLAFHARISALESKVDSSKSGSRVENKPVSSMLENKKGNIIVIGSVVSRTGAGGGMHYAASKTALIGIVNRINYELLSKGIRANMISPGVIDTPMLRKKYPDTPEVNKKIIESIPFGRIGLPGDIADLALFLASDMSEYICGQDILVDGGRLLYRKPVKK